MKGMLALAYPSIPQRGVGHCISYAAHQCLSTVSFIDANLRRFHFLTLQHRIYTLTKYLPGINLLMSADFE
jgi:hypothetical protein